MAEVPFVPYPTVQNTGAGGAMLSVPNANAEAFGAGVGLAMQRFGASLQQASDVTAQKTLEFQQIQNETNANNAIMAGEVEMGKEVQKLKSLEGQNAVNYLPEYNKNMEAIRKRILGNADNPAVARLVDSALMRRMGFALIDGSGYAGTEAKRALSQSLEGAQALAQGQAQTADDLTFEKNSLPSLIKSAQEYADMHLSGRDTDAGKAYVQEQVGKAWAARIGMVSLTDPFKAKRMLDQHQTDLGTHYTTALQHINQAAVGEGAKQAAAETSPYQPSSDAISGSIKSIESGSTKGNYQSVGREVTNAKGVTGHAVGAYGVMSYNVGPWTEKWLGKRMTEAEFKADPMAQDKVFAGEFGSYMKKYGSVAAAAQAWFAGEGSVGKTSASINDGNLNINQYTQKFLDNLRKAGLNGETGAVQKPITADEEEQWVQKARARTAEMFPGNDAAMEATEQRVRVTAARTRSVAERQTKEIFDAVHAGAFGSDTVRPTTREELYKLDPNMKTAFWSLPVEKRQAIDATLKGNAEHKDVQWDDGRLKRYQTLLGLSYTDPERFRTMVLTDQDLPRSAIKELMTKQVTPEADKNAENIGITRMLNYGSETGRMAQLGLTDKSRPEYQLMVGQVRQYLEEYAVRNPRNKGGPSDDEMEKAWTELTKKVQVPRTGVLGGIIGGNTEVPGVMAPPALQETVRQAALAQTSVTDMPASLRKLGLYSGVGERVIQAATTALKRAPTMEEVVRLYLSSPGFYKAYPPVQGSMLDKAVRGVEQVPKGQ